MARPENMHMDNNIHTEQAIFKDISINAYHNTSYYCDVRGFKPPPSLSLLTLMTLKKLNSRMECWRRSES